MAPISLKDSEISFLTDELVYKLTKFKKSTRNFTLSSQFALSNFRYHKYLDVNSLAVTRLIDGVVQKFQVHSQYEKAESFQKLCDAFLNAPLSESSVDPKTDAHYALVSLLLLLSKNPTEHDYYPPKQSSEISDENDFNWKEYLLGDAEEEVIGIPTSGPCLEWSDDDLNSLEQSLTSESGIELSTGTDIMVHDTSNNSMASNVEKDGLWIGQRIVSQYWCEYPNSTYLNDSQTSKYDQCSLAKTWQTYQRNQDPFYQLNTKKIMTETQLVKETVWMLSGIENSFVYQFSHNKMQVNGGIEVSHLTQNSLKSLLATFAKLGEQSIQLKHFKASVLETQRNTTPTSMTIQAFANSLAKYFKEYKVFLSEIEKEIIKEESTVTLLHLYDRLGIKLKEIGTLYDIYKRGILDQVHNSLPQRVTHLLDTIYITLREADALGSSAQWKVSVLLTTFLDTLHPCIEFIDSWVTSGTFHDPANEFFILRDKSIPLQSTSFWEKGNTLRHAKPGDPKTSHLVPSFLSNLVQQILLAGQSVNVIQGLGKINALFLLQKDGSLYEEFQASFLPFFSSKRENSDHNHIKSQFVASISDKSISHDASSLRYLPTTDDGDTMLKASLMSCAPCSNYNHEYRVSTSGCQHDNSDPQHCMMPIEVLFTQSLFPLLQAKCTKACGALMSLLKSDFDLMEHLNAMRNVFLLEAGSTMHHFYLDIFKKVRRRQPWQDVSYLNSHLQEALLPFFPQYIDRLTISIAEHRLSGIQGLHNLTMYYKVPWPVSLVIDEFCLTKYNKVFIFLLTVKQVKWTLDSLRFTDLSGETNFHEASSDEEDEEKSDFGRLKKTVNQEIMQKMYILRFRLLHFVNSLHNYIMTRILHVTGLEFKESFSKAENLNDAVAEHRAYVEKVFERCLLSDKVGIIKEAITKVFSLVFQFQMKWDGSVHELSQEAVRKIDAEFSKCNHFLITFLGNIVKRGAFPHLESLAFSLSSSPV